MSNDPYSTNQFLVDEEDLTVQNGTLKFKDRTYDPGVFSGMGRCILRKNMVNGYNVLTQSAISKPNTVYEIRYDFDLRKEVITIPKGCILHFNGGSIKYGTINFNQCYIKAEPRCILPDITVGDGHYVSNQAIYSSWFEGGNRSDAKKIQQALNLAIRLDIIDNPNESVSAYRKDKTTKTIYLTPDTTYFIDESLYIYPGVSIDGQYARLAPLDCTDPILCQNITLKKDQNGNLILDENGKPIEIFILKSAVYSEIKNIHFDNSAYVGNPSPNGAFGIKFSGYVNIHNLVFDTFFTEIQRFSFPADEPYIDGITIESIDILSHIGGEPIIKIYQGDRTRINGINGPHNVNIQLGECHGGEVANCIGVGVIANYCNALTISNMHIEEGSTEYQSRFEFVGTVATLKDCILYERNNKIDEYTIKVALELPTTLPVNYSNKTSIITLNNVGIIRNLDRDYTRFNSISCDRRSTIIFNMCFVDYQHLSKKEGFTGLFMSPLINSVYSEKINTFNGTYSGGKFREFTRELSVVNNEIIDAVPTTGGNMTSGTTNINETGYYPWEYEYYAIPLVSGSRHIGYSKGSKRMTPEKADGKNAVNINMLYWGLNDNYLNNIIRICRRNKKNNTVQYIEFISLGRLSCSLLDRGHDVKNIGPWHNYDDSITILEGYKCTISHDNIVAQVKNIQLASQLPTRSFVTGDIVESGKKRFYYNNGKWEDMDEKGSTGTPVGNALAWDRISGDLSGWVNFFTLKKDTEPYRRRSLVLCISSTYYAGKTSTVNICVPYGGHAVPFVISSGKNHTDAVQLKYIYDSTDLHLYINTGSFCVHSVKMLQTDLAASSYSIPMTAGTLPASAISFGVV